jgi:hypothetical protein
MNVVDRVSWIQRLRDLPRDADGHRLPLIVDTYAAHRCQEVRDLAESLNIEMHFIPAGATDTMRPPGRYVFGAMKASYRRIYRARVAERGTRERTKRDFVVQLLAAWEAVNRATLERSWEMDGTE